MCGIVGFIDKKNKLTHKEKVFIIGKMLRSIEHRGRDETGFCIHGNVALGTNRLSIININEHSQQPIENIRAILSYNGEIYNYKDLMCSVHQSDTSMLLDYLSHDGNISKLDGIYAFVFLDKTENVVKLQVDSFGVKPLYYYENDRFFAWSSEIKAFSMLPSYSFSFNERRLNEYLVYRCVSGEETLICEVKKVLPGQSVRFNLSTNRLHALKVALPVRISSKASVPEMCLPTIKKAVADNLMADVPLGVQLSGGIDSTLVALLAKEMYPNLRTYSIGMKDMAWNEFEYSDQVARKIFSKHTKITFTLKEVAQLFDEITLYLDEPIIHINTIPLFLLSKKARKHVKVLLTGEGVDELVGGYRRYDHLSGRELFNTFSSPSVVKKFLNREYQFSNLGRKKYFESKRGISSLKKYSLYDIQTYLPNVLLRQDKAGMAANIENRTPFLNKEVSEYLFNLSDKDKRGKYGGKNIFKEILLSKYNFSKDFVNRRKCGFGLPIDVMMRDKNLLGDRVLKLPEHPLIKKYLSVPNVKDVIQKFLSGEVTHVNFLFTLISLTAWWDIFIDSSNSEYSKKSIDMR